MSDLYLDTSRSPEQRAQALLEELSLPEKMAQVRGIFPFGAYGENWEAISRMTKNGIGQVSTLQMREFHTKEACCAWQRRIQEIVMENSPHHIPAAFHMEGLCGAFIQGSVSLPSGIARGAGWDTALEEQLGRVVSRQEAACGITQTLAPVLDVAREPRMGRHGEPYGEDPTLVAAMGTAYLKGLQAEKTAGRETEGAAKHFLAFHNSQGGIHGTHSLTTSRELQEVYGKPFQAAIAKGGLKGVMPCYCLIDGEPVHASRKLLTGLLREEMGFAGVTVSDYSGVAHTHEDQHVEETMEEAALRCMAAGMDVELPSEHAYSDSLEQLFATGKADMAILDQAVLRVLTAKFRTGLFEHPFALEGEELDSAFFDGGDRELTLRSARESLVLLKNDGLLPLPKKGLTIALIGPQADHANKFFGGYTHVAMAESTYAVRASIAGVDQEGAQGPGVTYVPGTQIQSDETPEIQAVLRRQKPGCKSLLQELRDRLPEAQILYAYGYPVAGEDTSGYEEALSQIRQADVAILTLAASTAPAPFPPWARGWTPRPSICPPARKASSAKRRLWASRCWPCTWTAAPFPAMPRTSAAPPFWSAGALRRLAPRQSATCCWATTTPAGSYPCPWHTTPGRCRCTTATPGAPAGTRAKASAFPTMWTAPTGRAIPLALACPTPALPMRTWRFPGRRSRRERAWRLPSPWRTPALSLGTRWPSSTSPTCTPV